MPFPGPQTRALNSKADILFFGGAAGGGKTFLLLGLAALHHRRSIIFRREFKQLEDIREKAERLYHNIGTFNGQRELWRLENEGIKRRVRFGAMQLPGDEQAYQGQQQDLHCVAGSTPILMADGSKKAIERVCLGDLVQTLEGARRVVRLIPKRRERGVLVRVYDSVGRLVGSQVQSRQHAVLTPLGWVSHDNGSEALPSFLFSSQSMGCYSDDKGALPTYSQYLGLRQHPATRPLDQQRVSRVCPEEPRRQDWLGTVALSALRVQETACGLSWYERQEGALRPSGSRQSGLELGSPVLQSDPPGRGFFPTDDGACERSWSSRQYSMDRCSVYTHLGDDQPPLSLGHRSDAEVDRSYPPLLVYAEPPIPNRSGGGDPGDTPRYNSRERRYPHPYRSETRSTAADLTAAPWDSSPCGEVDLYDIEVDEVNHYISGPGLISKNCFDEITHFTEQSFRFVTGWNRSDVPGQRSRVIAAGNPPTNAEGYWVIKYWGPWLDPKYPNPAKDGELRWFAQLKDKNGRFVDMEVPDATPINVPGELYPVKPRSRTFIRAFLTDNPVYMASGYMSVLQGMPEPLRSQMLHGDFLVGHEDHPRQVIPTEWVMQAQARWRPKSELDARIRLDCIGVDVARGGKDNFVLSPRYGTWFDEQTTFPGTETPNGFAALELIVAAIPVGERPALNIDVVGVGSAVYDLAKGSGLNAFAMDARHTSYARDSSGALGFARKKSEWWWLLRESLDPNLGDDLAIPPDRQLLADLTAPRYEMKTSGIQVEDKEDLISRIGRSPDHGDALVLAHARSVSPISTHLL